jgi:Uri superfamily endonuclease
VERHFSADKSIFWHIDRIIASGARPSHAIIAESDERIECQLSLALVGSPTFELGPKGFGASDCQGKCGTHLFRYIGKMPVLNSLKAIFTRFGLGPQILYN